MNIEAALAHLEKLRDGRNPDTVWTPLPVCERLIVGWEATHLWNVARRDVLPIQGLFARQRFVRVKELQAFIERLRDGDMSDFGTDEIVALWQGAAYIIDGHHRIAACHMAGVKDVSVLVVRLRPDGSLPHGS